MNKSKIVLRSYVQGAVFLLLIWWLIALIMKLPIVPPPDKVFLKLGQIFLSVIGLHGAYSLWRIVAGLALAVAVVIRLVSSWAIFGGRTVIRRRWCSI